MNVKEVFDNAVQLPAGHKIVLEFQETGKMMSYRTLLFRQKKLLREKMPELADDVQISYNKAACTVTLSKACSDFTANVISPDGKTARIE